MKTVFLIGIDQILNKKLIKLINEYDKIFKITVIDDNIIRQNIAYKKPYLIIINFKSINSNTLNFISYLRQNNELYYIPIIVINDQELDHINKKKLQKQNIDLFIIKPITKDKIYNCLKFIERIKNLEDGFFNIVKSYKINFERHQLFQNIIETVQIIILILDIKGHIINFNPYLEKISGYKLKEVQFKNWFTIFLEKNNQEKTKELFLKAINNIQTEGNIDTIVAKNGNILYIEWYDKTLKDNNGNVKGLVCIGLNVTERKRIEESLNEDEERLKILFDCAPEAYFVIDMEGKFLNINKTTENIFGFKREFLLDKKLFAMEFLPHNFSEKIKTILQKSKQGISTGPEELFIIKKNGRNIYIEIYSFPVKIKNNDLVLIIVRDITDRKLLEEEKKLKETFISRLERFTSLSHLSSAISHEIKQPLQSIKVLTDSVLYLESINKKLSYEEILEDIKEISSRVDKIDKIITNLNYLIKAPEKIEIKNIDINQEIEKAVGFYNKKLMSHCITLDLKLSNIKLMGLASEIQFQQVLINIINNSISSLDSIEKNNKKIIIATREEESNIIIEIIDNGTGFNEEQRKHLFDPFYSLNTGDDNLGMGLYIVNNIIKCFLGSIDLKNNEYKGATVIIKLKKQMD